MMPENRHETAQALGEVAVDSYEANPSLRFDSIKQDYWKRESLFSFAREKYPDTDLYNYSVDVERNIRIDPIRAASSLRLALETFVAIILKDNNISVSINYSFNNLFEKLKDALHLDVRAQGFLHRMKEGQKKTINWPDEYNSNFKRLRALTNAAHHIEDTKKDTDAKLMTEQNVAYAARVYYLELCKYAQLYPVNAISWPIGDFYELKKLAKNAAPLNRIEVLSAKRSISAPGLDSHAILYVYSHRGEGLSDGIINRQGIVKDIERSSGLNPIVPNVEVVADTYDSKILAYTFATEPIVLLPDSFDLELSDAEYCELFTRIAAGLAALQDSSPPVFHRAISRYAVVFEKTSAGRYLPKLINFNLAKVEGLAGTVGPDLKGVLISNAYKPPELHLDTSCTDEMGQSKLNVDWGKYDVYALGVLFLDVLNRLTGTVTLAQAKKLHPPAADGLSEDFYYLLEKMVDPAPENRPNMTMVAKQLAQP
ncbi:MAG: hypothetical protein LBI64_03930 [Coriobacteriales bacterium]|jgi:hypothetical protein|nr:hypothetical protein [Coriobacteriales bacterium]